jgi:hypothetical protein
MTMISDDDIMYAVESRRQQDAGYRRQLDYAVERRDDSAIERLIEDAVMRILGIVVRLTFDIVREVWRWLTS